MFFRKQYWEYGPIYFPIKMFLKKHVKSLRNHFPVERTLSLKKGIKAITCSCHREEIEIREKYQIVKKRWHFHCYWMLNMKHLLSLVKDTQQIYLLLDNMVQIFFCKIVGSYDLCSSCVAKRYAINFRVMSLVFKKM